MVLRPVELHAAGDPRPEKAHQRRLDHVLAVEKVVLIGFVGSRVNPPANLGQNHESNELVFKKDCAIFPVFLRQGHAIGEGIGIDLSAAPLIDALFQKHRIGIGILNRVSRDIYLLLVTANYFMFGFAHLVSAPILWIDLNFRARR